MHAAIKGYMGSVYLTTPFRNLKYILSGVLQERIPWTALVEDRQEQLTLRERSGEVEEMKETLRGRAMETCRV